MENQIDVSLKLIEVSLKLNVDWTTTHDSKREHDDI